MISDRFVSGFEESSESLFGLCLFGLIIHVTSATLKPLNPKSLNPPSAIDFLPFPPSSRGCRVGTRVSRSSDRRSDGSCELQGHPESRNMDGPFLPGLRQKTKSLGRRNKTSGQSFSPRHLSLLLSQRRLNAPQKLRTGLACCNSNLSGLYCKSCLPVLESG